MTTEKSKSHFNEQISAMAVQSISMIDDSVFGGNSSIGSVGIERSPSQQGIVLSLSSYSDDASFLRINFNDRTNRIKIEHGSCVQRIPAEVMTNTPETLQDRINDAVNFWVRSNSRLAFCQ